MNLAEPIPVDAKNRKGSNAAPSGRRGRGPTLKELIDMGRPVSVEELCGALPFLSVRTAQRALRRGEIPGVKITERKWAVSRSWLIKLSEQQSDKAERPAKR